jgi:hypothetical protein
MAITAVLWWLLRLVLVLVLLQMETIRRHPPAMLSGETRETAVAEKMAATTTSHRLPHDKTDMDLDVAGGWA